MTNRDIPFNWPTFVGQEQKYLLEALNFGHISGNGSFTRKCQTLLETELGVARALLTTSCTHALEMAALLLDIQPGDEVIVPSFTFVSTINAFVLRGARPVFIDSRPDTLNLDETRLEGLLTPRTRAVVPVHYAGVGCEMDTILDVTRRHGVAIVEDNAHGLFARYRGQQLGTFGVLATQSFHETKNFSCGEGGALLINDPSYADRAEIIWEKGTNRSRFFRGQVDKYTWVDVGSSYLPSDLLAAILFAQLEERQRIQERRKQLWDFYYQNLASWTREVGVQLPTVPSHCEQSYHLFYLLFPTSAQRDAMIERLAARRIHSVFHYVPLHTSEMGERFGWRPGDCPVAESASDRLLRLPMYYGLSEEDQERVVESILQADLASART